jgi:cytidylate kinase
MDEPAGKHPLVGVVGPCGSGKSTLITGLQQTGYTCRHIAQEHSYVPYMWQRISHPDILIFLDASFQVCTARRRLNWTNADFQEQMRRLSHAREHADFLVDTNDLTAPQVLEHVLDYLNSLA